MQSILLFFFCIFVKIYMRVLFVIVVINFSTHSWSNIPNEVVHLGTAANVFIAVGILSKYVCVFISIELVLRSTYRL